MKSFEGTAEPVGTRVLIKNMHFGEQTTASGLVIVDDDGTTRGIYPRWGQVHSKGPENNDPYEKNQWVLIEHGRWTRGMKVDTDDEGEITIHMVDDECISWFDMQGPAQHNNAQEKCHQQQWIGCKRNGPKLLYG